MGKLLLYFETFICILLFITIYACTSSPSNVVSTVPLSPQEPSKPGDTKTLTADIAQGADEESAKRIADRLGTTLSPAELVNKSLLPANKDIPYIYKYWVSQKAINSTRSILIIFRLADEGMNFVHTQGFQVSDPENKIDTQINREESGWYSCIVTFPGDARTGEHTVKFKLTDTQGNSNTQDFKLQVR